MDGTDPNLTDAMDRHRVSRAGSTMDGSGRLPTPLMEVEEYGGLQPLAPVRTSKGSDEHYPRSPGGISDQHDPQFHESSTEQYQSFEPPHHHPDDSPTLGTPVAESTAFNDSRGPVMGESSPGRHATASGDPMSTYDLSERGHPGFVSTSPVGHPGPSSSPPHHPDNNPGLDRVQSPPPPLKGRDSLPSQQLRYSTIPTGGHDVQTASQSYQGESGNSHRESYNVEDWPEEAILYQTRNDSGY